MMMLNSLLVLAAAMFALAKTPNGFQPASNSDLMVFYNNTAALNGIAVAKLVTTSEPQIGTVARLTGKTYAVLMIDLDIPTNSSKTNTLLHWMQTDLTPATTASRFTAANGSVSVFLLENRGNTSAFAPYIGPNPPARIPLSHRYTQILVDTTNLTSQGASELQTAAATRIGFTASTVLAQAGLSGKVVAGNSYNVTNPWPVQAATGATNANTSTSTTKTGATNTASFVPGASSTFASEAGGSLRYESFALVAALGVMVLIV
ncbi:phosphatidylethanolamine-binding protein [Podospora appendiculata]|uniref:Phosphatidylethanolamine-binding protein n=1 Tax=Podospora appendiculata TaxID=314037 RepID=A0AAE0X6A2_9PEZI|nr:phosphatidylethanolamine-binding protein [Podospora appendiculata]